MPKRNETKSSLLRAPAASDRVRLDRRNPSGKPEAPALDEAGTVRQAKDLGLDSQGEQLDPTMRRAMEGRFRRDFSSVRVHADGEAAASADRLGARAFTVGSDIVLGASAQSEGAVDPHLLAHELAHVAQPSSGARESVGTPGDASERAADRAADAAMRGAVVGQLNASSAAVQRQPLPGRSRASAGDELLKGASPRLASVLVSDTLDAFDTGKADLSAKHRKQLETIAHRVTVLLEPYNVSTLEVIGHADTVGGEPFNLSLGQMRADAVRDELIRLGVPDSMITTGSKGEGEPQAVSTKNETPNARNRRVEVVFHPKAVTLPGFGGTLTPPTPPPESKPIDLTYHPKIDPDGPPPDFFKPIPPLPKGAGPKSVLDVIGEKILDPVIDSVAGKLPKSIRDKLKEGARSAVSAGTAKGARAAAEAAGVTDPAALDAIEKAAEAAIKEKGKPSP